MKFLSASQSIIGLFCSDGSAKNKSRYISQADLQSQRENWQLKEEQMGHKAEELQELVRKQEIQLHMLQTKLQETVQASENIILPD